MSEHAHCDQCSSPSPSTGARSNQKGVAFTSHPETAEDAEDGSKTYRDGPHAIIDMTSPGLNPFQPDFDFQCWSRSITNLRAQMGMPTPPRSDVLLRNLNVHARNQPGRIQAALAWIRQLIRPRKQIRATPILQNINAVIRKGELVLVLGRPGSGCSTFLKTITGEMQGLQLASHSIIQYNGLNPLLHRRRASSNQDSRNPSPRHK